MHKIQNIQNTEHTENTKFEAASLIERFENCKSILFQSRQGEDLELVLEG